jgi:large subunit ribosomal protein L19
MIYWCKSTNFHRNISLFKGKFVPLHPLFGVTYGGKSRVARLCCVGTIQQNKVKRKKMDLIKVAEEAFATGKEFPKFKAGDTITVAYKIIEGSKERIQLYRGVVIKIAGHGDKKRFTVRKMSGTVGVERIFPIESPNIESIEINKVGKVRRAKLYYLRKLTGKAARIKEKRRALTAE